MARSLKKNRNRRCRQKEQKKFPNMGQNSRLAQWPVQIKLVSVNAPYFENAQLLIAADCTAYAYADFHEKFIKDHVTLIGCPKLDEGDYADKLAEIIGNNSIRSIRIVRMEVPCCGGIENAVIRAMERSGKMIPWQVVTIACDGTIRRSCKERNKNSMSEETLEISFDEIEKEREKYLLVDTRDKVTVEYGMIPGAISVPEQELEERAEELKGDKIPVLYCTRGLFSQEGAGMLREKRNSRTEPEGRIYRMAFPADAERVQ